MNIDKARFNLSLRSKMCRSIKMNYPSDKAYAASMWACAHCPAVDSQAHPSWCSAYAHLREGVDPNTDLGLVTFYQAVIKYREENQDY